MYGLALVGHAHAQSLTALTPHIPRLSAGGMIPVLMVDKYGSILHI